MPGMTITIDADVIQADGGTRTASICGGFLALKDAVDKLLASGDLKENPIIEPIGAISIGIVDNEIKLDLCYEEDSHAQVDSNVILTKSGKIVDFQTTAEGEPYEKSQMLEIFDTAKEGIDKINEMLMNLNSDGDIIDSINLNMTVDNDSYYDGEWSM